MKMMIDVQHCNELNCQYLSKEVNYPADPFEEPYESAKCVHPDRPAINTSLGCSDDFPYEDYCKIPCWCPRLKEQQVVSEESWNALKNSVDELICNFKKCCDKFVHDAYDKAAGQPPEHNPDNSRDGGYWIPVYQGDEVINYRCSECEIGDTFGKLPYGMYYCPKCGAKMRGVKDVQVPLAYCEDRRSENDSRN